MNGEDQLYNMLNKCNIYDWHSSSCVYPNSLTEQVTCPRQSLLLSVIPNPDLEPAWMCVKVTCLGITLCKYHRQKK